MTNPQIPAPVDSKTANDAKKALVRALGWEPNDVLRVEVTSAFIRVVATDRQTYTMTTKNFTTTEWVPKSAPYSHAANLR